jgi:hypothetical protein
MGLGIGWSFGIILGFVGKCTLWLFYDSLYSQKSLISVLSNFWENEALSIYIMDFTRGLAPWPLGPSLFRALKSLKIVCIAYYCKSHQISSQNTIEYHRTAINTTASNALFWMLKKHQF